MDPLETPHGRVALRFATSLVEGRFEEAHQLLSTAAQLEWPLPLLRSTYQDMIGYFGVEPSEAVVVNTMEEWPDKQSTDLGWAYAAIVGEGESEAVSVVVCDEGGQHLVRSVEWGRP